MHYVSSKIVEKCEERAFQNYVADGIKILTQNTACAEKYYMAMHFRDLLQGKTPAPEKSAEEIIQDIKNAIEGD